MLTLRFTPNQRVHLEAIRALLGEHHIAFPFGDGSVTNEADHISIAWWDEAPFAVEDVVAAAEHLSMRYPTIQVEVLSDWSSLGQVGVEGTRWRGGVIFEVGRSQIEWRAT